VGGGGGAATGNQQNKPQLGQLEEAQKKIDACVRSRVARPLRRC